MGDPARRKEYQAREDLRFGMLDVMTQYYSNDRIVCSHAANPPPGKEECFEKGCTDRVIKMNQRPFKHYGMAVRLAEERRRHRP